MRHNPRMGAPRYGYRRVRRGGLVVDDREQIGVALIRRLSREGRTLREIAAELDARGIRPRRSNNWHPMAVKRILEYGNQPR